MHDCRFLISESRKNAEADTAGVHGEGPSSLGVVGVRPSHWFMVWLSKCGLTEEAACESACHQSPVWRTLCGMTGLLRPSPAAIHGCAEAVAAAAKVRTLAIPATFLAERCQTVCLCLKDGALDQVVME